MRRILSVLSSLLVLAACSSSPSSERIVEDFNFDWRFTLGDSPEFSAEGFDDSSWRPLHLPHDWSVEGNFSAENPSTPGGGALPGGIGWYRKTFTVPEFGKDIDGKPLKRYNVEFDGVFMNSTVWVNGVELGTRPYGYSSFCYDITAYLHPGEQNTIAVRCDNAEQPNSRWYAGCGIYRNVRLVCTAQTRVGYNGTYVSTPLVGETSKVKAQVEVVSDVAVPEAKVVFSVLDAKGKKKVSQSQTLSLSEGSNNVESAELSLEETHLWSTTDPYLYTFRTDIYSDGELLDSYLTRFGVRTISWDADKGFFLNGESTKLLGVCLHHDMGCLGTAVHHRALERELSILKGMGVNALRTSHNPPTPELLDLCDEMGILVMDEGLDMWRRRKTKYDYARFFDEWHQRDIQDFVRRDRNHPSVIMWSIGNEIPEQSDSKQDLGSLDIEEANRLVNFIKTISEGETSDETNPNMLLARHLTRLVHELDTTRAITSGCNGVWPGNNIIRSGAVDVIGINYHPQLYDSVRVWFPGKPIIGSETASAINSRGVYYQPSSHRQSLPSGGPWFEGQQEAHQCTAYDACAVPWGNTHEEAWTAIRDRDFVAGTFLWTGFDYLGEPTPYWWPSRSSYFGVVDLAGFPKDAYWLYKSEWTSETTLHLFPHWNWKEGDKIDVWAFYNNADEVELLLNGRSLGRQSKTADCLHAQWLEVPWEPGKIEAKSYKDGKLVAEDVQYTTGEPVALRLTADRGTIDADGYDLSYVTVEAVDDNGRAVPTADALLSFSVEGEGELVGVDNGNAAGSYSLKGSQMPLFSGKALAVVRSLRGQKGIATLSVSSPYGSTKLNINVK